MSKIQPLADRVLVKPAAAEEKTVGGIIIPDSAKEKPLRGEVLAVGNGTKDEEMVLKAGDQVLFDFNADKYDAFSRSYANTEAMIPEIKVVFNNPDYKK